MVPLIARAASPQALLSLRYMDGTCLRRDCLEAKLGFV
jgi:hypothetical protein